MAETEKNGKGMSWAMRVIPLALLTSCDQLDTTSVHDPKPAPGGERVEAAEEPGCSGHGCGITVAPTEPESTLEAVPTTDELGDRGGEIGQLEQPVQTSEATINFTDNVNLSESSVGVVQGSDGTWQTVSFANATNASGLISTNWNYGCIRGSTTHRDFNMTWTDVGSDPALIGGGGFMYSIKLRASADTTGFVIARSSNPCPSAGNATWNQCSFTVPADFTRAVTASSTTLWLIADDLNVSANAPMTLYKVNWCTGMSRYTFGAQDQCPNAGRARRADGTLGGNGIIHAVYWDDQANEAKHTTFNTTTNKWDCNSHPIDDLDEVTGIECPGGAPGTSRPVHPNLGNDDLRFVVSPRIARDSQGTLYVAYETADGGETEGRIYTSTNSGQSWSWRVVTTEVAHAGVDANHPNAQVQWVFHSGSGQGRQAYWRTVDGGTSWTATFMSNARNLTQVSGANIKPCYWGDYDDTVYHPGNAAFYHAWSDGTASVGEFVTRGRFINQ